MSPSETLAQLLKISPSTGGFVFGGLGVMAAAAMVLSYGSDVSDAAAAALYVLAFGIAVAILAHITNQPLMRRTICWIFIAAFAGWVVGLFESAIQVTGKLPRTPCYVRLLVELPEHCEARLAPSIAVIGGEDRAALAAPPLLHRAAAGAQAAPAARLWTAQAPDLPPAVPGATLVLQYEASITRDEALQLSQALEAAGWAFRGGTESAEAVRQGPGQNEVRFFHADDQETALTLARSINALAPDSTISVRDFTRLGTYAPRGQIEIWLADLPLGLAT